MNQNFPTDGYGRILTVLDDSNISLQVTSSIDTPLQVEITNPLIDEGVDGIFVRTKDKNSDSVLSAANSIDGKLPPLYTEAPIDGMPVFVIGGEMEVNIGNIPQVDLAPNLQSGRLPVDGSGVTQPISGSVSISNFPATQPISAVSLPLPSGAATETTLSTFSAKIPTAASLSDSTANPSTPLLGAALMGWTGTAWRRIQVNGSNNALAITNVGYPSLRIGAQTSGGVLTDIVCDSSGRLRIMPAGNAPHADATTDVYTRYPAHGSGPQAVTGAATLKASGGRVRSIHIRYTGASGSVFIQLHNAASTGAIATTTLSVPGFEVGSANRTIIISFPHDIPCTTGISIAASSTCESYTAAGSETLSVVVFGA